MSSSNPDTIEMTSGPIFPAVLRFSLPLAIAGMLQLLFNAADTVVVGQFAGSLCLAAVGATSSLINTLIGLFMGISVGVNIVVARYLGSKNEEGVTKSIHTAIALSLWLSLFVTAGCELLCVPLLRAMGTPEELLPLSACYTRIYFIGLPANLTYNFASAVLRAFGDTKRPMYFLGFSGLLNLILNLIMVVCFKMDVAGVAIATVVSQYASVFLVLRCLSRFEGSAKLSLHNLKLDKAESVQMIKIGLPVGVQTALSSFSSTLIQKALNSFGSAAIAANTATVHLTNFINIAMNAVFNAAITFTSQNYGAKSYSRICKILRTCCLCILIIAIPLCIFNTFCVRPLLNIFISKADPLYDEIVRLGVVKMYYVCLPFFLWGIAEVICGMVRGLGKTWLPMIVSTAGSCGVRILWLWTVFRRHPTFEVLHISYPASWSITLVAHFICFVVCWKKLQKQIANDNISA